MHTRSRICRQQKKVTVVAEKKVKELITSAKKQKHGGIGSNKLREVEEARDLNTTFGFVQEETLGLSVAFNNALEDERPDKTIAQCVPDTIFSSAYHHAKDCCGAIPDKETLVHSSLDPCPDADFTFPVNFNFKEHTIYVRCRPFLKDFMERVSGLFETIIFTASQSIYAERLLNILDPKRRVFRHRIYRESCVYVEGNYLKDLSVLGRDLSHVIIIDNSPQAFGFQLDNGIPIESWFEDRTDQALLTLLPFLESLVGTDDVRPMIAKRFNLSEKVAGLAYPC